MVVLSLTLFLSYAHTYMHISACVYTYVYEGCSNKKQATEVNQSGRTTHATTFARNVACNLHMRSTPCKSATGLQQHGQGSLGRCNLECAHATATLSQPNKNANIVVAILGTWRHTGRQERASARAYFWALTSRQTVSTAALLKGTTNSVANPRIRLLGTIPAMKTAQDQLHRALATMVGARCSDSGQGHTQGCGQSCDARQCNFRLDLKFWQYVSAALP